MYAKVGALLNKNIFIHVTKIINDEFFTAIALVCGTTVGAGILALPHISYSAGYIPSSLLLLVCWLAMAATAMLIAEVTCNLKVNKTEAYEKPLGILSLVSQILGKNESLLCGLIYIILHYALLSAYIGQAGDVLTLILPSYAFVGPTLFASVLGFFLCFSSDMAVEAVCNGLFIVVMLVFVFLVCASIPGVKLSNLKRQNYAAMPSIAPTILMLVMYHNIIPNICEKLKYNRRVVVSALLLGSLIPLLMFLTWNFIVLGSGLDDGVDLNDAFGSTVELLSAEAGWNMSAPLSIFCESVNVTCLIGFYIGLMNFFIDLIAVRTHKDPLLCLVVLGPSTVIAIVMPHLFNAAMDYAGAYGIAVLFGIAPVLMAFKMRRERARDSGGASGVDSTGLSKKLHSSSQDYEIFLPGGNVVLLILMTFFVAVIGWRVVL